MLVRMCFCVCASGYTIWQRERYIINRRLKLPNTKLNHYRVNYRKILKFLGPLSWKTSRTYFCINHSYKIFSIQSHWSVNFSLVSRHLIYMFLRTMYTNFYLQVRDNLRTNWHKTQFTQFKSLVQNFSSNGCM